MVTIVMYFAENKNYPLWMFPSVSPLQSYLYVYLGTYVMCEQLVK